MRHHRCTLVISETCVSVVGGDMQHVHSQVAEKSDAPSGTRIYVSPAPFLPSVAKTHGHISVVKMEVELQTSLTIEKVTQ